MPSNSKWYRNDGLGLLPGLNMIGNGLPAKGGEHFQAFYRLRKNGRHIILRNTPQDLFDSFTPEAQIILPCNVIESLGQKPSVTIIQVHNDTRNVSVAKFL